MTPEEERLGAEMFAEGKSEREVAAQLDISPSSAHRFRVRLEKRKETPVTQDEDERGTASTCTPGDEDSPQAAEEAALTAMRGELETQIAGNRERADASLTALRQLEAERLQVLSEGGDAQPLRGRLVSAKADLDDWATSSHLLEQKLAAVDQRLAELAAHRELAGLRAQLAPVVAERDAAIRATGGRMAAAVLAVKAAAEEFTAALADEKTARERAELVAAQVASLAGPLGEPGPDLPAEPESTALPLRGDAPGGPELALIRAVNGAAAGHVQTVAGHLAEAFGWLPQSRAEQAAEQERMRQWRAGMDRQQRQQQPSQPWTRPDTSVVELDENGREVYYRPGYRPPLAAHPLDVYRFPVPGNYPTGYQAS